MELLLALWWLVPLAALAALLTATTGMGGGVLLLGVLGMVLPPLAVVPIHGAMMLLQGSFRLGFLWRSIDWQFIRYAAIGAVVGVAMAGPVALLIAPPYSSGDAGFWAACFNLGPSAENADT